MQGRVVDARGAALQGAHIVADNTQFYDMNALGVSDAQGRYTIDVSQPVGTWRASATVERRYNGRRYVLSLHPDDDAPFAGNAGAIRNFSWQLSGERPDGLGTYGMPVIYYFDVNTYEDPDYPGEFIETRHVELTLTPSGPLIDGSAGRTIAALGRNTADGPAVTDVPIGRYDIRARYLAPGRPPRALRLRLYNDETYLPRVTADFEEVMRTLYQIRIDVDFDTAGRRGDARAD